MVLPEHPGVIIMFLMALAQSTSSYTVVKTASAAILTHHELAGVVVSPVKHGFRENVRAAAKRQFGSRYGTVRSRR